MRWFRHSAAVVLSLASANALAQDGSATGWTVEAGIYGWLMATEGSLGTGGSEVEVDNSFADTLEQSDSLLALMGRVEAWRGDAGLFLDGAFVKLGYDDVAAGAAEAEASTDLGIVELGGLYRFGTWPFDTVRRWSLDGLGGARYSYVGSEIDIAGGPSADSTTDWVDPFVGLRATAELSDRWDVSLRGDVGGFGIGSDFTWQAIALARYRFSLFGADAMAAVGYRLLDQDYDSSDFDWDITLHGPVLGLGVQF